MTRSVMSNGFTVAISGRSATFGYANPTAAVISGARPVGAGWSSTIGATKVAGGGLELATLAPTRLGNAAIDVVAKTKLSPAAIAKAIAKPTAGMALALAASLALKPLLDEACIRLRGGSMQLAAGAEWEECVKEASMQYRIVNYDSPWRDSQPAACTAFVAYWNANVTRYTGMTISFVDVAGGTCNVKQVYQGSGNVANERAPYGFETSGSGTPKPTDRYTDVSADSVQSTPQTKIPESNSLPGIAREILESGGEIDGDDMTVSGPSEVANPKIEEEKSVKETPDPQPDNPNAKRREETTTKTKTSEKLTYDKDTVSASEKKEEERCIKVITGSGKESTACDGAVTESTKPKGEDSDLCKLHPEILACKEIDVPEAEIPKKTRELTYTEESIFGSGTCPADRFSMVGGQSMKVVDWAQSCDYVARYFRPLFLAMGALVAFIILIPAKTEL